MRKFALILAILVAAAAFVCAGGRSDAASCPYLPQLKTLEKKLPGMTPAAGLAALYRYTADPKNENPDACESFELDRLMSERERTLVALAAGKTRLHPQAAYRCGAIDQSTTLCNGAVADDTAHPLSAGIRPRHLTGPLEARLQSALPEARLDGVYRTTIAALFDGKPPTRLDPAAPDIAIEPTQETTVLIVIFRAPPPWRYRKLLWYFD